MKSYTFHVSIPGTGRTWRKIELPAHYTLSHLHHAIQDAFDFDNDHLYSFFMSGQAWDSNSEYKLPEGSTPWEVGELLSPEEAALKVAEDDEQEQLLRQGFKDQIEETMGSDASARRLYGLLDLFMEVSRPSGNVLTTTLDSLKLQRKQSFMYLFDYGDEWCFKVRVHAISENADPDAKYARIVESVGEAPAQYPDWDGDEDEDEYEDE